MNKASIIIADDHPLLLKGLYDFLIERNYYVLDKVTDGISAYNSIVKNSPDIAILDIEMPKLTGIEVAKKCKTNKLSTKIILLTLHREKSLFFRSKELNIYGYLLKDFAIDEIETCLQSVINDIPYFTPKIRSLLNKEKSNNELLSNLTPSEIKILKLIAKDKTNKEIAEMLFISVRTVEKHRSNIITKLSLSPKTNSLLIWAKEHHNLL
ncbi:response regulator [Abyssalbus ytuae]|uniref:Response regulator transcription factor n=1 Tax=Abyssalbus ytuae TaxID=2926907 RepID=A0A9E7D4K7_9FLAO|nr:response regulator transcription factor [Abyssalbus ytuae]UOB19044.1 response regulator transcription factor [Abyssalbus ytuae]